ncbi:MAG: glycosyl hydrolase 108 family protein [Betaproteobacteria bacterium]
MADFEKAFARLMDEEGIKLTSDPVDRGGQTYCGISRKHNPKWVGWKFIDAGDTPPLDMVRDFYREEYWQPIWGDQINSQRVAEVLFSQYVNNKEAGVKLMQKCVGVIADGKVGPKTIAAINSATERMKMEPEDVLLSFYSFAHSARYHAIGMADKTQRRFWPGWWARAMRIVR